MVLAAIGRVQAAHNGPIEEEKKMNLARLIQIACKGLIGVATAAMVSRAGLAAGTYDINVVLPLTGSAAFVGQGQKDSLAALQDQINATGGVSGDKLNFIFRDDQTQPQLAVQLASQIVGSQPAVIMG